LRRLAAADLCPGVHGATAFLSAAIADGFVVAAVIEAIIVSNFFACCDGADGLNPNAAANFAGLAVGVAAVIDEHCHAVAVDDDLARP
jgi:hypothetical protein